MIGSSVVLRAFGEVRNGKLLAGTGVITFERIACGEYSFDIGGSPGHPLLWFVTFNRPGFTWGVAVGLDRLSIMTTEYLPSDEPFTFAALSPEVPLVP